MSSIGDVLHVANWASPEYWKRKVGGEFELKQLQLISNILRSSKTTGEAAPQEALAVAHSIENWSQFSALPFKIRASVLYVTQKDHASYRGICQQELWKSAKRVFTFARVSTATVRKELERAVGTSLASLKGDPLFEAIKIAVHSDESLPKKMGERNRLNNILKPEDDWEKYCTKHELEEIKEKHCEIMKKHMQQEIEERKRAGAAEIFDKLKNIINNPDAGANPMKTIGAVGIESDQRLFLGQSATKRVEQDIENPRSDYNKRCLVEAKHCILDEKIKLNEEKLSHDLATIANKAADQGKVDKDTFTQGPWKKVIDGVEKLFITINDELRKKDAPQGQSVPLSKEGETFLLGGLKKQRELQKQQRKDHKHAISVATNVAKIGGIVLAAVVTAPITIPVGLVVLLFAGALASGI